ncbi:hypothetical protein [Gorillibacterium sp. CAU 1737]|uniref:hypothetical protein n=1 Tax=Gorillibacterium sp. CAU 1737 TaxID=3140362 RepID=UPI003261962F
MIEPILPSRTRAAVASLAQEGIVFAGCYYSCSLAIRAGWFVPRREGELVDGKLAVTYKEGCYPPEELELVSAEGLNGEPVIARRLLHASMEESDRLAYQEQFQALLAAWKLKRPRRRRRAAAHGTALLRPE